MKWLNHSKASGPIADSNKAILVESGFFVISFLVIKFELLDPWSLIFGGFPCKDRYSGGLKSWSILVSFMHYSTPCNIRLKTCIYYLFITMTKIWPGYLCIPKVWQDYT